MQRKVFTLFFASSLFALAGCEKENAISKGALGESCARRDDCASGLACLENRCVSDTSGDVLDGGTTPVVSSGGKAGESCTRRADCQTGLACFEQTCTTESLVLSDAGIPTTRGERGETCAARNDCKSGLSCVMGRCRESNYDVTTQAKECFRVECESEADCCENFTPPTDCDYWLSLCTDGGGSFYCDTYNSQCKCPYGCEENLCVFQDKCTTDIDCGFSLPQCVNERCVQCETKADCADDEAQCVDGVCKAACERNEQCPIFNACKSGKCVEVGCTSDRECYFASNDPRSKCLDHECISPCENDAECTQPFNVCEKGKCVFVGCESNEECRVLLGVANETGGDTAVCKLPEAK